MTDKISWLGVSIDFYFFLNFNGIRHWFIKCLGKWRITCLNVLLNHTYTLTTVYYVH